MSRVSSAEPLFPQGTTEAVHVTSGFNGRTRLVRIIKQTATQLVIAGSREGTELRFNASDGYERGVGRGFGSSSYLRPASTEWRERARLCAAIEEIDAAARRVERWARSRSQRPDLRRSLGTLELAATRFRSAVETLEKAEAEAGNASA